MATFQFQGIYQTHVELPDGSYRLTDPGEVADLDFDKPGPLWEPYTRNKTEAKAAAKADATTESEQS